MKYDTLMWLHLCTVIPAFFIASWLMIRKKGDGKHKLMGRIYITLMLLSAFITLFMQARVGPQFLNHFGFIHLLSIGVIYTIFTAIKDARHNNIISHQKRMSALYIGGLILAGAFTFLPGRFLGDALLNALN